MILGIDEVGRGPWAGPLVIGAVILPPYFDANENPLKDQSWQFALADSKKLSAKKREALSAEILEKAIFTGLGWVSAAEIDQIGLSESLKLATRRAIENLPLDSFSEIIIDGTVNFLKDTPLENKVSVLPKADAKIREVSAASIIAKVARDRYMIELAEKYPGYGFEKHVGYGTATHRAALESLGPCPEHRTSFRPVKKENLTKKESPTTKKGSRAEDIVAAYLKSRGHKILARNYKTKFYEIDIISADQNHIYFTEVKYRQSDHSGSPLEAIDQKKQKQISFAAESFMKYLSKNLKKSLKDLPSPVLCAASVKGPDFTFDKWLEIGL